MTTIRISSVAKESLVRNTNQAVQEVRSVTNAQALVRTQDFFEHSRTSANTSNYKIVEPGMFAYNPSRVNIGSIAVSREPSPVIVSPMYVVFDVDKSKILPQYLMLQISSSRLRSEISSATEIGARFRLPFSRLGEIEISLPSLTVQQEIVRSLDQFTALEAELEAELEARRVQYEYYRDALLSTHLPAGVEFKTLGELLGPIPRGKRLTKTNLALRGSIPVFHGGLSPIGYHDKANTPGETVMVINTGASSGSVGWSNEPFWCSDGCFALPHSQTLSSRYLFHYASLNQRYFTAKVRKAGIPTLASDSILSLKIPVLPLERQIEIVRILDALLDLTSNLSIGLPAEIEARRNQYEYYRDKLLTFPEPAV